MKYILITLFNVITFAVGGPKHFQVAYPQEIACITQGVDGVQTLAIWCGGRVNQTDCSEAQKRVVSAIIWDGIKLSDVCSPVPLVIDPSVRHNNMAFISKFFAEKGDYTKFSKIVTRSGLRQACNSQPHRIMVSVERPALHTYLISRKIPSRL